MKKNINISDPSDFQTLTVGRGDSIITKARDEEMKELREEMNALKNDLNFFIGQVHDLRQSLYDLKKQINENK